MRYDFDIAIIGGGAGGLFAASVANGLGAKACLIEKSRLGGDCTWFGCMPSKALLKSAQIAHLFKRYAEFGLDAQGGFSVDASKVMSHVRDVVEEIATHHPAEVFEKRGIKVIFGSPKFIDQKSLEINSQKITAKKFIICTGSHPVIPLIEGFKEIDYLTNENVFALEKPPESIIVLGGGPIGVELAQALNRLGVKVYIVEMMQRLLFREDDEISSLLEKTVRREGIQVLTSTKAIKFSKDNGKTCVTIEVQNKKPLSTYEVAKGKQDTICADKVLAAIGRAPNTGGLDLEKAGVEYAKTGIKVNEFLQTTNKNIFACGDVVGPYMFSHVASYQAQICVRNAFLRRIAWGKVNYQSIAWATFTEPEVAHLGLTEEEAGAKYKNMRVYKTEYSSVDRAVTDLEKEGLIKVITDKKGFILGAHIVGAQASEIIQGFLLAKFFKIPLSKLSQALFIYPTLSELVKKTAAKPLLEKANNPLVKFALSMLKT
mgnify:CR=1 FL=1